jgi:hypothetical protein
MKISKICIVCSKEFIKPKSCGLPEWFGCERRPKGRLFCSKSCQGKHRAKTSIIGKPFTKERHYIPPTAFKKGQRPSIKTEFKKGQVAWNKNLGGTDYLSDEVRKKMSYWGDKHGEGTPNWRGGTTKLGQLIRSQRIYYHWRTECFQRDNWACVNCGEKRSVGNRVILHWDHIKPFYKILEENKITTVEQAKECKELWDITNGRTLCIPCHKQTPSYLVNQYTK